MRKELSAQDPADVQMRWEAAASRAKVAELKFQLGDTAGAEKDLTAAMAILNQASQSSSRNQEFQQANASAQLLKGRIYESRGDMVHAREEWNKAAVGFEKMEKFAPYQFFMLRYYAETLLRLDKLDDAEKVVAKLRHLGYKGVNLNKMLTAKGLQPL